MEDPEESPVPVTVASSAALLSDEKPSVGFDLRSDIPTPALGRTYVEHLGLLAAALTSAVTAEEAADASLRIGIAAVGANAGSVALFSPDASELITLRCLGYPAEVMARYQRYAADTSLPNADAARTGRALFIPTLQERNARYPHLASNVISGGRGAAAALPLIADTRVLGAVVWSFPSDREFPDEECIFLETVASLCALAIERVKNQIRFKALFDHSRDAIGVAANGRIWYANQAFATLLGYASPDDLVSLSTLDVVAPSDRPRLREVARRRAAGEATPDVYQYRGIRKDGTEIDIENRVTYYAESGEHHTLVMARDVTARNKRVRAQRFLIDASLVLSSSLDVASTLQNVARLAVPHLADWCIVHLGDAEGVLHQVAVSHVDPQKVVMAREVGKRYPTDPQSSRGVYAVFRSGQTECITQITEEMLRAAAKDAEHLAILKEVGMQSFLSVPLVARDRRLGVITFLGAETGHRYGPEEVTLAEDLGRRAGLAIENARLFQAEQQARQAVEGLNARLRQAMTETHHRVKNNLQVIAAMIEMRMDELERVDPVAEFHKLSVAVRTLAALHDLLTRQAKVDAAADHVSARELLEQVLSIHQMAAEHRSLQLAAEEVFLSIRQATGLALVFNELITNGLKHGRGAVEATFRQIDGERRLEVYNEGPGFSEEFTLRRENTSGLELVETIVRWDLGGGISYRNRDDGGAVVTVTFPEA